MSLVGRKSEIVAMKSYLLDDKAHLLAVIGRRRVGKTYLIKQIYNKNKVFEMVGLKDANVERQLLNFSIQLNTYFKRGKKKKSPENWLLAFNELTQLLKKRNSNKKQVIFFDEVPWIATKRSGFTEALAHWWNNWASDQKIVVVICGSAASWMIRHIVNAKGGLYNRLTKLITLMPFTLAETKDFLVSKNIQMSHYQIIQIYMVMGGIPHYLEQIERGKSAIQNINNICFLKDGKLKNEFNNLYPALFENADKHIKIIKALSSKSIGLDRQEILTKTNMSDGGWFSGVLEELETSGFISTYTPLEKKKKDTLYRVTDEFSLFYLRFMDEDIVDDNTDWIEISQTQKYKIWCGYAFENLCLKHTREIKQTLGISGIISTVNSYLHRENSLYEKGFQIDMLIDRKDNVINICEMKFYADEFSINASYAKNLRTKKEGLKAVAKTKKTVLLTFITTYGVFENQQKIDLVDNDLTIDLFFN